MHAVWIVALLAFVSIGGPILALGAVVMIKLTNAITTRIGWTLRSSRR
jgi:hypothetical protein